MDFFCDVPVLIMDWNSEEGRKLLWAAHPSGWLPVVGVGTLEGGRVCRVSSVGVTMCMVYYDGRASYGVFLPDFMEAAKRHKVNGNFDPESQAMVNRYLAGDLLPLPSIDDPATWYCMLVDLAVAVGWNPTQYATGLWWGPYFNALGAKLEVRGQRVGWKLLGAGESPLCPNVTRLFEQEVARADDSTEALVRARIQLREQETKHAI